jgi:hypothetical protein
VDVQIGIPEGVGPCQGRLGCGCRGLLLLRFEWERARSMSAW